MEPPITPGDLEALLTLFSKTTYDPREANTRTNQVLSKCQELLGRDYKCVVVANSSGELCGSYPSHLLIPECEKDGGDDEGEPHEPGPAPAPPPPRRSPLTLTSPSSAPSFSSVLRGAHSTSGGVDGPGREDRRASTPADGSVRGPVGDAMAEAQSEGSRLRDLILKAKFARCRARFPVPVILYKGNYICRSSTLSGGPEMYGRSGIEYLFAGPTTAATAATANTTSGTSTRLEDQEDGEEVTQGNSDWQLFDRVRSQDIRLLKACSVGVIVDLMVEKKKVKYGVYVTSSEKVDKEKRYSEFSILSLPYPGCEFFREFRDHGYTADGLAFNWNQAFMDAHLVIPERTMSCRVTADWNSYRKWDLVQLTQNYLKLLLTYAHEGTQGLLVHCISGWDRTPLFVSLLRLSLWADGLVHASLGPTEILYLTIAYDWFLFGHDLRDRLAKGEEIFFFCFDFLKYITADDFCLAKRRRHPSSDSGSLERSEYGLLLDTDGLSSAGSSNSLNSSCSSSRSSHPPPPRYFRTGGREGSGEAYTSAHHLTWPYGSDCGDLDFDDFSPNLSRTSSSASSSRGFGRSSLREEARPGSSHKGSGSSLADVSRQTVSWSRARNSESSGESSEQGSGREEPPEPPQRTSTSPVAVPVPRGRAVPRARQESVSSVGSWQIITTTGSLRGSTASSNASSAAAPPAPPLGSSRSSRTSMGSDLVDSASTIKEEASSLGGSQQLGKPFNRVERLAKVRSAFYNQYVTAIGFTACNGRHESGLGTLVSNFAQKVGIKPSSHRGT